LRYTNSITFYMAEYNHLQEKLEKRALKRAGKKRAKMKVSGRSVKNLKKIIEKSG